MKHSILFFLSFLSVACSTMKQVTPREQTTVEVRTNTVFVPDTVYIEIPRIVEKVQTLDTISVIDTKFAVSEAQVSNGVLAHSLEIKPVREPAIVQKEIVYRDSVVLQQMDVDHYIEVPAELSWWQQLKLRIGGIALGIIITLIVCAAIYFVSHSKLFKL